jgi:hypothetical protein
MTCLREQGFGLFVIVHKNSRRRLLREDRASHEVKIHAKQQGSDEFI